MEVWSVEIRLPIWKYHQVHFFTTIYSHTPYFHTSTLSSGSLKLQNKIGSLVDAGLHVNRGFMRLDNIQGGCKAQAQGRFV